MIGAEARSRRDLIATVTGGALLGALWGAAFPIVATERRPTIAVVGHHGAQIILIDTASSRVLFLSGEPDRDLLETLPAVMTVFRQRIDLVLATSSVLADNIQALQQRWRIRRAIALEGKTSAATFLVPTTVVDDGIDVSLDESTELRIRMGHRKAWLSTVQGPIPPIWRATIATRAGNVVVVPDIASLAAIGAPAASLLISPDAPVDELLRISPASAIAVNYDSETIRPAPKSGPALTRIYPVDVARFVIGEGAVILPEWTTLFEDAADSR